MIKNERMRKLSSLLLNNIKVQLLKNKQRILLMILWIKIIVHIVLRTLFQVRRKIKNEVVSESTILIGPEVILVH